MPYSRRRCPGSPTCPAILTQGERYCPEHAVQYEQRRGSRQQRGYGREHDRLRAMWQQRINRGEVIYCAKGCGRRVTGSAWDLGHTDDRAGWTGPECSHCNRSAGGKRSARTRR